MKKIKLIAIVAAIMVALVSCGQKKAEETKMIPSDAVKKSGEHSNLLSVDADSVKIMLVNTKGESWEVRALIPLTNEFLWENVPETDPTADEYYTPSMGNLAIEFLDANGTPLENISIEVDYDVIESLLSSNDYKTEDFVIKEYFGNSYKNMKAQFDKVAGISIKKMDLVKSYNSSGSYSSSTSSDSSDNSNYDGDDDDDDWEEVEKAAKATKSAYKAAKKAYKVAKELDEMDDDDWDW